MNESFDRKFKIPKQYKEGHNEKLILVAARINDADDVKMLARGIVGTGMGFPNLSVDQDIKSISSTKIRANSLAVSSKSLL